MKIAIEFKKKTLNSEVRFYIRNLIVIQKDEIEQLKEQLVTMTVDVMNLKDQLEDQATPDPETSQTVFISIEIS